MQLHGVTFLMNFILKDILFYEQLIYSYQNK